MKIYSKYDFLLKLITGLTFFRGRIPFLPQTMVAWAIAIEDLQQHSGWLMMWVATAQIDFCDRRSRLVSGESQISHRQRDEITNESPITIEKQRSWSLFGDSMFSCNRDLQTMCISWIFDDIAAAVDSEDSWTISPVTLRFASSIMISGGRDWISSDMATVGALGSIGTRSPMTEAAAAASWLN